jgi:hypothetical protein
MKKYHLQKTPGVKQGALQVVPKIYRCSQYWDWDKTLKKVSEIQKIKKFSSAMVRNVLKCYFFFKFFFN